MATDFITNNSTIIQIQKNYNKAYEIVAEHKEKNHRRGFGNRYAR